MRTYCMVNDGQKVIAIGILRREELSKPRQSKRKEMADLTDFAVSTMSSTYISFGKT
jgi:hypothetical protein